MKYWAYVNNEILGPFEKEKLLELPAFSPSLLVCPQTPVGEKTEDWKETSTYPELAALIGAGANKASSPAPAPQPAPSPAQESAPRDVVEPGPALTTFKPLKAASIDPIAPAEHKLGGVEISVNRLGKAGGDAAPAAAQPAPSAFDPISLSTIVRRTENIQEAAGDGIAKEPPKAFGEISPAAAGPAGLEISAITRENAAPSGDFAPQRFGESAPAAAAPAQQPEPAPAPQPEPAPEPAPQPVSGSAPVTDTAGLATLLQRLDYMAKSSVNRQDINAAVEPLRSKLDQMGEVISAIKNSQFQREVMDKLNYLENSVTEMKSAVKNIQSAPAPVQQAPQPAPQPTVSMEKASDVFMGVQSPPKAAQKPEPAKEAAKPAEIVDQGSKPSRLVPALKKAAKALVTVALLIAVALGAVIGLKNFGIFDATKFIPFQLPFVAAEAQPAAEQTAEAAQGAADAIAAMAAADQQAAQAEAGQAGQPQEQAQAQAQSSAMPERAPEVIYFIRNFKLKADGPSMEDRISVHSAKLGADYNRIEWQVKQAVPGVFEITGTMPAKVGTLAYTFTVNLDEKTLQPADDTAKAAYADLTAASAPKARAPRQKPGRAAKTAPKGQKKAAPKKLAPPPAEDEYEYVYEDEEGATQ